MKLKQAFLCVSICWAVYVYGQSVPSQRHPQQPDSFLFYTDTAGIGDSLRADNMYGYNKAGAHAGLLDTLSNDSLLRMLIKPYQFISGSYTARSQVRRSIPTIKEIQVRQRLNAPWKFWVILFIFAYISFVRIANPNNFRVFMLSVFNLKLSDKIWDDQRSFFGFVILQLFAIYLFIAAIFINNRLEVHNIRFVDNYFFQFILVFAVLALVYLVKFALHTLLGALLGMKKLGIGFVSNTISINNFLAVVIFPVIIFTVYYHNAIWSSVLAQTVVAVFFISIIYRVIRISLLSNRFFSFPRIYLFIYLCALEILPWFVIVKFLNSLQI